MIKTTKLLQTSSTIPEIENKQVLEDYLISKNYTSDNLLEGVKNVDKGYALIYNLTYLGEGIYYEYIHSEHKVIKYSIKIHDCKSSNIRDYLIFVTKKIDFNDTKLKIDLNENVRKRRELWKKYNNPFSYELQKKEEYCLNAVEFEKQHRHHLSVFKEIVVAFSQIE